MSKIGLEMTTMEAVIAMSEGNPGAMVALVEIMKKQDWYGNTEGLMFMLYLDDLEIYGENIHKLYKYVCNFDLNTFELVIRNYQMGNFNKEDIYKGLQTKEYGYGPGIPVQNWEKRLLSLEELFGPKEFKLGDFFTAKVEDEPEEEINLSSFHSPRAARGGHRESIGVVNKGIEFHYDKKEE
jgi:hypothetical protein